MKNSKILSDIIHNYFDTSNISIEEVTLPEASSKSIHAYYSSVTMKSYSISYYGYSSISSYQHFMKGIVRKFEMVLEESLDDNNFDNSHFSKISKICVHLDQLLGVFKKVNCNDYLLYMHFRMDNCCDFIRSVDKLFFDNKQGLTTRIIMFQNAQYVALNQINTMLRSFTSNIKLRLELSSMSKVSNKSTINKLKLNVSARSIGAFVHVMRNVGEVFANQNVTQISKAVSNAITTASYGDISVDYFRNQQYKPATNDLKAVRNYLKKMITFINSQLQVLN